MTTSRKNSFPPAGRDITFSWVPRSFPHSSEKTVSNLAVSMQIVALDWIRNVISSPASPPSIPSPDATDVVDSARVMYLSSAATTMASAGRRFTFEPLPLLVEANSASMPTWNVAVTLLMPGR